MKPETFWSYVDRSAGPDACWPWIRTRDANGYGWLRWHGARSRAHRVALELDGRPCEDAQVGRHLCNNPCCCNPQHLAPGTRADDAADRVKAGHHKGHSLITTAQIADLCDLRSQGYTSPVLASRFGINASRVRYLYKAFMRRSQTQPSLDLYGEHHE